MTNKHTPGSWIVGDSIGANIVTKKGEINACFTTIKSDAFCIGGEVAMVHVKADSDQTNANARLISAAPDLLDALEDAVDMIETLIAHGTPITESGKAALDGYRAAIAKARGEA